VATSAKAHGTYEEAGTEAVGCLLVSRKVTVQIRGGRMEMGPST
jgi:hypothetical protein